MGSDFGPWALSCAHNYGLEAVGHLLETQKVFDGIVHEARPQQANMAISLESI